MNGAKLNDATSPRSVDQQQACSLSDLPTCSHCDGKGCVGQESAHGRIAYVNCSDCFGTGKEGGDHVRFREDDVNADEDGKLDFGGLEGEGW